MACVNHNLTQTPIPVAPLDVSQKHRAPCPQCGAATAVGVPKCSVCGHAPSLEPGTVKLPRPKLDGSQEASRITCKRCSYDLTGLKAAVCPECGTSFSHYSRKVDYEEDSQEVARKEYTKGAILMVSGLLVMFLVAAFTGRWSMLISYGIMYVLSVVITYAVASLCFLTFMGVGSSLPLMALQVAGIHAVCFATLAIVNSMGMLGLVWSVGVVIMYVYMMSELLDQDPSDARIIAVLSIFGLAVCTVVGRGLGIL